jgi:hypothetical protein
VRDALPFGEGALKRPRSWMGFTRDRGRWARQCRPSCVRAGSLRTMLHRDRSQGISLLLRTTLESWHPRRRSRRRLLPRLGRIDPAWVVFRASSCTS